MKAAQANLLLQDRLTFRPKSAFILIYVIYLVVALGGQALHSRLRGNYDPQAKLSREAKSVCGPSRSSFKSQPEDLAPNRPQFELQQTDVQDSSE